MNDQLSQVRKCCREGNYVSGLKLLNKIRNHDFDYWILYCEICIELEMYEKAESAILNAIDINGDSDYAWYLKAKASIGLENYRNARKACLRALTIETTDEYVRLKTQIEYFINASRLPKYMNMHDNLVELTKRENIELLDQRKLDGFVYRNILDDIVKKAVNETELEGDVYAKMKTITQKFIDIDFSFESHDLGEKRRLMGAYAFNRMKLDTNHVKTLQIAVMIHELAHHLLCEIFKQTMMYVYDSSRTDTIEAFSWYCITNDVYWRLMNEYCAHSVECHYMPYSYCNYESFNHILSYYGDLNDVKVKKAVELANSLAEDIIYMLDEFITDDLKEEIRVQYLSDHYISARKTAGVKSERKYEEEEKFDMINSILRQTLIDIKINLSYSEVYRLKRVFTQVNKDG